MPGQMKYAPPHGLGSVLPGLAQYPGETATHSNELDSPGDEPYVPAGQGFGIELPSGQK